MAAARLHRSLSISMRNAAAIATAFAALAALAVLAFASAAHAARQPAPAQPKPQTCAVTVDRSQPAGVFDVTRQTMPNKACTCYIYTGPPDQYAKVEAKVTAIRDSGQCPQARVQSVTGPTRVRGSGFFGGGLSPLLGVGGFGGGVTTGLTTDTATRPASP